MAVAQSPSPKCFNEETSPVSAHQKLLYLDVLTFFPPQFALEILSLLIQLSVVLSWKK